MPTFIANADYEDRDRTAITLQPSDEVTLGPADRTWPGWIWVTDTHGRKGYVPIEILGPATGGQARVTQTFDPTVLTIRRGDRLEAMREVHGWHWCRNAAGQEGWVAGYLLHPA